MGLLDFFGKTIGVDPGSENLRLIHDGKVIFNETCKLSINPETKKVSGYGNESISAAPHKVIKPINKVIADFHAFEHLLRGALKKALNPKTFFLPSYNIYISLPLTATEVEKRPYRESVKHAGAKRVFMIHQPCSSAIGMGILFEKKEFVLVDFSASKIEITIFANSYPVTESCICIGTWQLKWALRNYIYRSHNLNLTDEQQESVLIDLPKLNKELNIENKKINTEELNQVLAPYFAIIEDQVLEIFERAGNNKLFSKILSNGFYFTGGGSHFNWICKRIALNSKINISISPNPLMDNINGLNKVIQNPDQYEHYLMS